VGRGVDEWIQVDLQTVKPVLYIVLSPPSGAMPGGWSLNHLVGCLLQISNDANIWKDVSIVGGQLEGAELRTSIKPAENLYYFIGRPLRFARIWRSHVARVYVATSTFILTGIDPTSLSTELQSYILQVPKDQEFLRRHIVHSTHFLPSDIFEIVLEYLK